MTMNNVSAHIIEFHTGKDSRLSGQANSWKDAGRSSNNNVSIPVSTDVKVSGIFRMHTWTFFYFLVGNYTAAYLAKPCRCWSDAC